MRASEETLLLQSSIKKNHQLVKAEKQTSEEESDSEDGLQSAAVRHWWDEACGNSAVPLKKIRSVHEYNFVQNVRRFRSR